MPNFAYLQIVMTHNILYFSIKHMNWDITGFYGTFLGNYAPKVPIHCHNPCKTFVKQIICF